jgi:hypothetical protein
MSLRADGRGGRPPPRGKGALAERVCARLWAQRKIEDQALWRSARTIISLAFVRWRLR